VLEMYVLGITAGTSHFFITLPNLGQLARF
jgi:hypothetical protein